METALQIPYDNCAEESVLGALLINPKLLSDVIQIINSNDFYVTQNQAMFVGIRETINKHQHIDPVKLRSTLEKQGTFDESGGIERIFDLMSCIFSLDSNSIKHHSKIIKDNSLRRAGIERYNIAIRGLFDKSKKVEDVNDYVIREMSKGDNYDKEYKNYSESFMEFFDDLEKRKKAGGGMPGISSGFGDFDEFTGGFESGKVYIVGGRPAMGKTAIALNFITKIAEQGKTVAFFSLEMKNKEVMKRLVSSTTGIQSRKIKYAMILDEDYEKLGMALNFFNENDINISDDSYQTASTITSKCAKINLDLLKCGKKIDVVVIDYLQLMSNENKRLDRRLAVGETSRMLKIMSKNLNCAVIVLSQLTRECEKRNNKRPQLSDLRETGDIEQDADVIAFLYREYYYNPEAPPNESELIFAKNRDGEIGTIKLNWNPETQRFIKN